MSRLVEFHAKRRLTAHLFDENVQYGLMGYWYRFWWRFLLGVRIKIDKSIKKSEEL